LLFYQQRKYAKNGLDEAYDCADDLLINIDETVQEDSKRINNYHKEVDENIVKLTSIDGHARKNSSSHLALAKNPKVQRHFDSSSPWPHNSWWTLPEALLRSSKALDSVNLAATLDFRLSVSLAAIQSNCLDLIPFELLSAVLSIPRLMRTEVVAWRGRDSFEWDYSWVRSRILWRERDRVMKLSKHEEADRQSDLSYQHGFIRTKRFR
jgi:hypothetical protein